jgi:predicted DNA-binding transcriptional regulator YafY
MARNDRLFTLIQTLRDGQLHRAGDLAKMLGVSTRTIWRDMAALQASGLPVEGERGIGYVLKGPVSLPPLALTREEFEALRLGLALVGSAADPALAKAATSLRGKVGAVTPQGQQEPGLQSFVFATPEAARAAPHLAPLRSALREHLLVEIVYAAPDVSTTTQIVRPLQLDFWGRVWTLTGFSETLQDFRVYRLDFMVRASVGSAGFLPEGGKTIDDFLAILTLP